MSKKEKLIKKFTPVPVRSDLILLHKKAAFQAVKRNLSLNRLVEDAIKHELTRPAPPRCLMEKA